MADRTAARWCCYVASVVVEGPQAPQDPRDVPTSFDLANLPAHELVPVLLRRLQEEIGGDTATVLALDGSGTQLLAHTALGLEEEVRQGFRLPIGAGFAGKVAATRQPVVIDEVGPENVSNPLLITKGLRRLAGVPLLAEDELVGVMHVGAREREPFGDAEVALMQRIGEQVAGALIAERARDEGRAAQVMQRSLLPTRLPIIDGLEFSARFVPASGSGVGGDWYDSFVLPGGRIVVVMGDVVGHGLQAAVVMGRLRSVVRAYAFESDDPADVLDRTDRKFGHFEPAEMATVLMVQIAPDLDRITIASAGHPPPVLVAPELEPQFVPLTTGPPIGYRTGRARDDTTIDFPTGASLMCFTDGLFERRQLPFDEALERLRRAVPAGPIEPAVSAVMAEMIDGRNLEDDTALLGVRRVPVDAGRPPTPKGAAEAAPWRYQR